MTDSLTDVDRSDIARIELAPPIAPTIAPLDAATFDASSLDRTSLDHLLDELETSRTLDAEGLVRTLTNLCEQRLAPGITAEAEQYATRAVAIAETQLGAQHPDLVILLNDVTRLCVRQQAFGAAEPFVLHLLDLKRGKGETHAEVATVLATLATIRQALGRHESAEELWRRVVVIREHTLAPNHFAIATALEHLAESCAARGKLRESLVMLRRAQAIREVTLGSDHPSLRAVRERIADLQLQDEEQDVAGDGDPAPSRVIPMEPRRATDVLPSPEPRPAMIQSPPALISSLAPAPVESITAAPIASLAPAPVASAPIPAPSQALATTTEVAYAEALIAVQREFSQDAASELAAEPENGVAGLWRRWRERGVLPKAALMLVLALILGPIWWRSELDGSSADTQYVATPRTPVVPTPEAPFSATPAPAPTSTIARPDASPASSIVPVRVTATAPQHALPAPAVSEATAAVAVPRLAASVIARADSAVRSVRVPDRNLSDPALKLVPSAGVITLPTSPRESATPPLRARIDGVVPTPKYPETLARSGINGEVRVRFAVDADGQPEMSTFEVVRSPHAQLTASVREVIARTHFEPARSATDGRALPDQVEMSFQFERPRQ